MKQYWRITMVILVGLLVQACGPQFETRYSYAPPPTNAGKLCATQCQTVKNYCRRTCRAEEGSCEAQQQSRAQQEYNQYAKRQQAAKREIERTPSSFLSYGACDAEMCNENCETDFRICYSTCGGEVRESVICTSGCEDVQSIQTIQPAGRTEAPRPSYRPAPPVLDERNVEASSLCRKGAKVEVFSDGDWYRAKVKAPPLRNGRCPVHYIGYDDSEDENVPLNKMRRIGE